jgi:hypothetical protein
MRAKISKRKKLQQSFPFYFVTRYNFFTFSKCSSFFSCSFPYCTFNFQGQDSVLNESFRTSQAWFDIIYFLIFSYYVLGGYYM